MSRTEEPSEAQRASAVYFFTPDAGMRGVFSNWASTPFVDGEITFRTAVHFIMYAKAMMFDAQRAPEILAAPTPLIAMSLGRLVRNYDEARWAGARFDVALRALRLKFAQDSTARRYLLASEDRYLVEASPHEKVWGIGYTAQIAPEASDWGQNLLGKALMQVRAEIRAERK